MSRVLLRALLLGLAGMVSCALPQTAPDAGAWGEPVNGVQLHLALATTGPPELPSNLPALEMQIRNRRHSTITVSLDELAHAHVEVDGHWYAQAYAVFGSAAVKIKPRAQSDVYRRAPIGSGVLTFGIGDDQGRQFELSPGRHRIRVGLDQGAFLSARKSGNWLASNPIIVDIPVWSVSAERDALIAQTSAGGVEYLAAAESLVKKYPDAAPAAIAAGLSKTTDRGFRSLYVEVAGTIPGEDVIPFLMTQIDPAVELASRISAAKGLLAHGREEGLWSLVDTWRHTDHKQWNNYEQADLLVFLARSGNPELIDQLGRMTDHAGNLVKRYDSVRLAVVKLFLPPDIWIGADFPVQMSGNGAPELPGGAAGAAAAERFLGGELYDIGTVPIEIKYEGVTYERPRVCDVAALTLSIRWPEKYRFTWSDKTADRDQQIDAIKAARTGQ